LKLIYFKYFLKPKVILVIKGVASSLPSYDKFMNPVLRAIRNLGGSGSVEEIVNEVANVMGLSEEQRQALHSRGKRERTVVDYRTAWARTYLKKYGLLENSERGVWALTKKGLKTIQVSPSEVVKFYKDSLKTIKEDLEDDEGVEEEQSWRDKLLPILLNMDPSAFERLAQRLLREAGFTQVEVTGRTGDGGIDGRGLLKFGGLLGFKVMFQCKRRQGRIGAGEIRDFRGAFIGKADKGLFITTGRFSSDAVREAQRDGAPAVDLIDGELLMEQLKEYDLGVHTKIIPFERITIDISWFKVI
jgi:restriction system protein